MATKSYKRTNNAVSTASEPQATYAQCQTECTPGANRASRMSVEEYFDKVWTAVLKKYEDIQR